MKSTLAADEAAARTVFRVEGVADTKSLQHTDATKRLGQLAVAAAVRQAERIDWLLSAGADPTLGVSSYLVTKGKAARTALHKFLGLHSQRYDYAAATPVKRGRASTSSCKLRLTME